MNFTPVLNNISRHISLNEDEINYFTSVITLREVKRKDLILEEGKECRAINYVVNGALRAYYLDREGKESTIMFAIADWWITDMYCFINQLPAMLNIDAIEDSCIYQLKKEDLDKLYVTVPKFERFFRIIMQNAYIREQLRVVQSLSLSAEERYNNFLLKYPQIVQQVTLKQIASYLGISPEFLSVIRKNKSKRKIS